MNRILAPKLATVTKPVKIAKLLKCSAVMVYDTKKNIGRLETGLEPTNNIVDISVYDSTIVNNLKTIILRIGDILTTKPLQKESSVQLMKSIGIAIDKLRLIEGKSTQNILVQTFHDLPNDIKTMLRETVSQYKDNKLNNATIRK